MALSAKPDKVAVFSNESIRAMGPAAQGIAQILKDAGWIQIADENLPGEPVAARNNRGIKSSSL
ncbi:MAG: hypothetical protein ABSG28_03820 [Methanoregula sp.]|jgi:hypothetical protein|uniref:hypothetical protein n=1 Tax=Methanoregula sp. TaxID=2052170 RepID=UPI003C29DB57